MLPLKAGDLAPNGVLEKRILSARKWDIKQQADFEVPHLALQNFLLVLKQPIPDSVPE